jgi:small subunit ribosomal protein S17
MKKTGLRKKLIGTVLNTKMDKTAVVEVERLMQHPVFKRFMRKRAKYLAHDPLNRCHEGDRVRIIESRPLSRKKRWQVIEILKAGHGEEEALELSASPEVSE